MTERWLANVAHRWLVRRGWIVQLNTPDRCTGHKVESKDGTKIYDQGWIPMPSHRYGHTPVYRGVGEARWP